jgi:hypothetical protein
MFGGRLVLSAGVPADKAGCSPSVRRLADGHTSQFFDFLPIYHQQDNDVGVSGGVLAEVSADFLLKAGELAVELHLDIAYPRSKEGPQTAHPGGKQGQDDDQVEDQG